jgi:hypothetical protein
MFLLYVYAVCPCSNYILRVHAPCICCMPVLHDYDHVMSPCCLSMLHVRALPCYMSMIHVPAACPHHDALLCCFFNHAYPFCMAIFACPFCITILYIHFACPFACPFCMSFLMPIMHVHAACLCFKSML